MSLKIEVKNSRERWSVYFAGVKDFVRKNFVAQELFGRVVSDLIVKGKFK